MVIQGRVYTKSLLEIYLCNFSGFSFKSNDYTYKIRVFLPNSKGRVGFKSTPHCIFLLTDKICRQNKIFANV